MGGPTHIVKGVAYSHPLASLRVLIALKNTLITKDLELIPQWLPNC